MSSSADAPDPEDELNPEARQIIFKARRSFGFSLAILLLGFIAIVMALVYRAVRDNGGAETAYSVPQVGIPAGADLISVAPGDGLLAVTYSKDGAVSVDLLDGKTGKLVRHIGVVSE